MEDQSYSQDHLERVAYDASQRAIKDTFKLFGCNIDDQESINEFRSDLIHTRRWRKFWERTVSKIGVIVLSIIIGGVLATFWSGFQQAMGV